jgi:uncharacterized protein YqeY
VSLLAELQDRTKSSLKAGKKDEVSALRLLISELQKAAKDKREELSPDEEIKVLRREHKRRLESAEAFSEGGRTELEAKERYEAQLIEAFLPAQMDQQAVRILVDQVVADTGASSLKDMGRVMSEVMQRGGPQIDGKEASRLVKERLSG